MAVTGAWLFSAALFHHQPPSLRGKANSLRTSIATPKKTEVKREQRSVAVLKENIEKEEKRLSGWNEYLEQLKEFIKPDGGPPRWFSPLECASRLDNSPLLLYLPGVTVVLLV